MSKDTVFNLKLDAPLREAFMAEAEAADRPASQIVRELMRDYIARQREARGYDAFLQRNVEVGRADKEADRGRTSEEVEADFQRRRENLRKAR